MNARFVFACAAAGLAMVGFAGPAGATPTSVTEEPGTLEISPAVVKPGEKVTLTATCSDPDFVLSRGFVESYYLVPTQATGAKDADGVWHLTGTTTVKEDAEPGQGSAAFPCGPDHNFIVAEFTIAVDQHFGDVSINPEIAKPGQDVSIAARCQDPEFTGSKVTSPALTAPDIVRKDGDYPSNSHFVTGKVAADAEPGTHRVSITCAGREVTGEFTVTAGDVPPPAQVPVKPKGAADTGSAEPAHAQQDLGVLALGGLAVLAAAGGGLFAYRRRHQE